MVLERAPGAFIALRAEACWLNALIMLLFFKNRLGAGFG